MSDIRKQLSPVDLLIRQARCEEALDVLKTIVKKKVPPEYLCEIAHMATRAGAPDIAIRLLRPLMRSEGKRERTPTDPERAEYALALIRIGATAKAEILLKSISSEKTPQALFYYASIKQNHWEVVSAIKFFKRYLACKGITDYQKVVCKLNLVWVLILNGKKAEAKALLGEAVDEATKAKWDVLYGNAIAYLGYIELKNQDYSSALHYLSGAEQILKKGSGKDLNRARVWSALARYFNEPKKKRHLKAVLQVREEAIKISNWESVRELDAHLAQFHRDEKLLLNVYFGTPFEGFRKHFLEGLPGVKIPEVYEWKPFAGTKSGAPVIDLVSGRPNDRLLKLGKGLHRLYTILLSDFYRPFSAVSLFEKLHADEHYLPGFSEGRIETTIRQLRNWLKENALPLCVETMPDGYKLVATGPCIIPVRIADYKTSGMKMRLQLLQERLGDDFALDKAADILRLKKRSLYYLIQAATKEGLIEKVEAAGPIRYRFLVTAKKAA